MSEINQQDARARRMRSLDIIRVHNPIDEDFIMWHDRFGPESRKVMIPGAKKDIGKGKGNNDLPRYLAQRFTKTIIEKIITDEADKQVEEIKKRDRRLPRPERLQALETEPVRTNDVKMWNELFPKVWLGVIEKYGEDVFDEPKDVVPDITGNMFRDTMEVSGLADKPFVERKNEQRNNVKK